MLDISKQYTLADLLLACLPEMWKDIPGYEGLYMASTYGRIVALEKNYIAGYGSKRHQPTKLLKPINMPDGYLKVALSHLGKRKDIGIHRVLGITFLENKENKPEINHKNLDKKCNYLWNLEWNTRSENNKHAFDYGANDIREYNNGKPPNTVSCIDIETGIFYDSIRDAANAKGINEGSLRAMLVGSYKNKTSIRYV